MGTTTGYADLYKPAVGENGWGALVNTSFDAIDRRLTDYFNVQNYGAVGDGSTNDAAAIQAAVNAASAAGGGTVFFPWPSASYKITTEVKLKPKVALVGAKGTPITGGIASAYVFESFAADSTALDDVVIDGFDINITGVANAGCIRMEYASRAIIRNCRLRNVAASGWAILIGVTNGADTVIRNSDILIENCDFDTHAGTLEQLLLYNAQRVTVRKCRFYNVTNGAGTAIGMYQKLNGVTVEDCLFDAVTGRNIYYSLSCDNITIRNNRFISGAEGIQGARLSDNGAFSATQVNNLVVDGNHFTNISSVPLDLGAVRAARVKDNHFVENNGSCIQIHDGFSPASGAPDDIIISGNQFRNNNNSAATHAYNVPIFFNSIGGSQHVEILGNQFFDDQGTRTVRHSISFSGAFTWDHITIANNRLDAEAGFASIARYDSAVFGSNVFIYNNRHNESLDIASAGTITLGHHSDYFNITGTTTITSVTASWVGRRVTLKFAGALTFTDGSNLKLVGNFVTAANATITLISDGTNWYEIGRAAPG